MVKINRPLIGSFAICIFLISCWSAWFSFSEYLAFFRLDYIVIFSWKVGVMIFAVPLLFYFSYLAFYSAITNKHAKMNNKLSNALAIIVIIGIVISLFSSVYIDNKLRERGYKICPRISWMDPNKFVKDINLCR